MSKVHIFHREKAILNAHDQVRVSFDNFWPGFSPHAFFLPFVSQSLGMHAVLSAGAESDLSFTSVFPRNNLFIRGVRMLFGPGAKQIPPRRTHGPRARVNIWYTGENERPPAAGFDLSYSYDSDSYGGGNSYLPLVITGLDWFSDGGAQKGLEYKRAGHIVAPSVVAKPRITNVASRPRFACAFIGNLEPTRLRALAALQRLGEVDVFGQGVNRPVRDKFSIAQHYKFMLCFENDLYPGYVTEKPLDAWGAGCIPLWRGIDNESLLNPASLLNAADFGSLENFVDSVAQLESDKEKLSQMGAESLFASEPSLQNASRALENIFNR